MWPSYYLENVLIVSRFCHLVINSQVRVGCKVCMETEVRGKHTGKRTTCYDKQNLLPPNLCIYPCDTESLIRQNTQAM